MQRLIDWLNGLIGIPSQYERGRKYAKQCIRNGASPSALRTEVECLGWMDFSGFERGILDECEEVESERKSN